MALKRENNWKERKTENDKKNTKLQKERRLKKRKLSWACLFVCLFGFMAYKPLLVI